MVNLDRTIKLIGGGKWVAFILGYIMYYITSRAFGSELAFLLGFAATGIFWTICRNEYIRLIGQSIATEIKEAIVLVGEIDNFVEIKRLRKGLIARVYLVNAKEKSTIFHKVIASKLDDCKYKKYLWVMQLTDMSSKDELIDTQNLLNSQLFDVLVKKKEEESNDKKGEGK